jgi:hypothetical protein
MDKFEIIISLVFIIGIGLILRLILRDPVLMIKTFLRRLKASGNWRLLVLFSPIWIPMWLIDRLFGLKIYISDFEDASTVKSIVFNDFDKYILIDTLDIKHIEQTLKSFHNAYDPNDYNYNLNGSEIKISKFDKFTVLRIDKSVQFDSFNALIQFIDNSAPQNRIYHVKGILINKINRFDSYFVFVDTVYPLKLIGKTYDNKKMYVDFNPDKEDGERIYLNSNIDYFKKLDFDKLIDNINVLKFNDYK